MSSDRLTNFIRQQATQLDGHMAQARFAIVRSIDPATHTAKVEYQPEGVLSGWLPIGTTMSGATGNGFVAPYNPGDQVIVQPTQGSIEHGYIACAIYSDDQAPPQLPTVPGQDPTHVEAGGFAVRHPSGASIRINRDGSMTITAPADLHVVGNLRVTGDVYDKLGSLDNLRQHYNGHRHTGVQSGGGSSGTTDRTDP